MKLPTYIDEPLMIAHLLGGANGVDFSKDIDEREIARRVQIAIAYGREIRRQLTLERNQPKTQTSSFGKPTTPSASKVSPTKEPNLC